MKKQIDLKLSLNIETKKTVQKAQLPIDEDTIFDIYYDIFNSSDSKYLYIKLVENTAETPFYYNRSYDMEELQNLHSIFKSVNMEDVKANLKHIFDKNKIRLFYDQGKEVIKMELRFMFFWTECTINFELYREMIPQERKDEKMLKLYNKNKKNIKIKKEICSLFKNLQNVDQNIIQELIGKLDLQDFNILDNQNNNNNNQDNNNQLIDLNNIDNQDNNIPLRENSNQNEINEMRNEQIQPKKFKNEKLKNIFNSLYRTQILNNEEGDYCLINIRNISDNVWKNNSIKFEFIEKDSTIKCTDIEYPFYDIGLGQDGDFKFYLENDKQSGKLCFKVFINGRELEGTILTIKVRRQN